MSAATRRARAARPRARRVAQALLVAAALVAVLTGIVLLADPQAGLAPATRTGLVVAGLLAALAVVVAGPPPSEARALRRTLGIGRATRPALLSGSADARALRLATVSARDFDLHLRPRLRELAAAALDARGVDLDGQPERVRALLGESAALVLPRATRPRRDDPGPDLDEVERLLDHVDALLTEEQ